MPFDDPHFSREALGPDLALELETLISTFGWRRHITGNRLMYRWAWLVDAVEGGYDDIYDEYANDLSNRSNLEHVIAESDDELRAALLRWVKPLDLRFEAATTRAKKPLLPNADGTDAASRWHWRVPKHPVDRLSDDLSTGGFI